MVCPNCCASQFLHWNYPWTSLQLEGFKSHQCQMTFSFTLFKAPFQPLGNFITFVYFDWISKIEVIVKSMAWDDFYLDGPGWVWTQDLWIASLERIPWATAAGAAAKKISLFILRLSKDKPGGVLWQQFYSLIRGLQGARPSEQCIDYQTGLIYLVSIL